MLPTICDRSASSLLRKLVKLLSTPVACFSSAASAGDGSPTLRLTLSPMLPSWAGMRSALYTPVSVSRPCFVAFSSTGSSLGRMGDSMCSIAHPTTSLACCDRMPSTMEVVISCSCLVAPSTVFMMAVTSSSTMSAKEPVGPASCTSLSAARKSNGLGTPARPFRSFLIPSMSTLSSGVANLSKKPAPAASIVKSGSWSSASAPSTSPEMALDRAACPSIGGSSLTHLPNSIRCGSGASPPSKSGPGDGISVRALPSGSSAGDGEAMAFNTGDGEALGASPASSCDMTGSNSSTGGSTVRSSCGSNSSTGGSTIRSSCGSSSSTGGSTVRSSCGSNSCTGGSAARSSCGSTGCMRSCSTP